MLGVLTKPGSNAHAHLHREACAPIRCSLVPILLIEVREAAHAIPCGDSVVRRHRQQQGKHRRVIMEEGCCNAWCGRALVLPFVKHIDLQTEWTRNTTLEDLSYMYAITISDAKTIAYLYNIAHKTAVRKAVAQIRTAAWIRRQRYVNHRQTTKGHGRSPITTLLSVCCVRG